MTALRSLEVPRTYAQWSACLDSLSEGTQDEACLTCMAQGELSWSGGVAPLFAERLSKEFESRLRRYADWLTRDLRLSGDESLVVRAILNTRNGLCFLNRLAQLPVLPETLRVHLSDEVRKFAERSQQSLEDSAKTDRSGRLPVLLRNNSLLRYQVAIDAAAPAGTTAASLAPPGAGAAQVPSAAVPAVGARRRNILS